MGRILSALNGRQNNLAAAKFEDELTIETEMVNLSGARLTMSQLVRRGDTLIFKATVQAVCMNAAGKPVRLPAEIRALLRKTP